LRCHRTNARRESAIGDSTRHHRRCRRSASTQHDIRRNVSAQRAALSVLPGGKSVPGRALGRHARAVELGRLLLDASSSSELCLLYISSSFSSSCARERRMASREEVLATDRLAWLLVIGRRLKVQYDAIRSPLPPALAMLLEQLEARERRRASELKAAECSLDGRQPSDDDGERT